MRIIIDGWNLTNIKAGIGNYTYNLLSHLMYIEKDSSTAVLLRPNMKEMAFRNTSVQTLYAKKLYSKYLPWDAENIGGKFDLYHEPNYIPRVFRGKTVTTICDMSYRLFPEYHPQRRVAVFRLFEHRMRSSDRIITISENSKSEIIKLLGIPEEKIAVTYLGASNDYKPITPQEEELTKIRKKYKLPEIFILYVGTIEPRKNLVRLIDAFNILKQQAIYRDIKLVLAGGKGWLHNQIFARVQELKMGTEVLFTGYISDEDLPSLYNMAMFFVYPSIYEGFGLPPLEAMSCGTPVISSNTSSIPEVVGDAGILVNPYDIVELAWAMVKMVDSNTLREDMVKKGLARAATFSWDKCTRETLQIYKDCMVD